MSMLAPEKLYFSRFGSLPSTFPLCSLQLTKLEKKKPWEEKKMNKQTKNQINHLKPFETPFASEKYSKSEETS